MERFGKAKESWFRGFLKLEHGIPSHDPFLRVFAALNPKEVALVFYEMDTSRETKGGARSGGDRWQDGIKGRQKSAGWNDSYLQRLLGNLVIV